MPLPYRVLSLSVPYHNSVVCYRCSTSYTRVTFTLMAARWARASKTSLPSSRRWQNILQLCCGYASSSTHGKTHLTTAGESLYPTGPYKDFRILVCPGGSFITDCLHCMTVNIELDPSKQREVKASIMRHMLIKACFLDAGLWVLAALRTISLCV